jgi:two-component system response regulator RegX3
VKDHKAKILVVEDDEAILGGLLDVFVFNGYEAKGVPDGGEGLTQALEGNWDLIILDVMLPTMDGFSICERVREAKPRQPIIMLTAKGAEADILAGFKAGADDYVSKPFSLRELLVRVEAVLRRSGKSTDQDPIELAGVAFDPANLKAEKDGEVVDLTRREMEITTYLVRNRDRIVSKKEFLTNVWGYADADIETRTVDIHIQKLRKKINQIAAGSDFIETVRGEGYRLREGV